MVAEPSRALEAGSNAAPGPGDGAAAAPPTPPKKRNFAADAGLVSVATMASRVFGLAREQVMAGIFGAGLATDAFNVAFRVPNLLRDLFAEGALSAAFVPTLTDWLTNSSRAAAMRLTSVVINCLPVVVGASGITFMLFGVPLSH